MREIIHAKPSEWPNVVASITGSVSLNSVCSVPPEQLPAVFGPHKAPDFIERFGRVLGCFYISD